LFERAGTDYARREIQGQRRWGVPTKENLRNINGGDRVQTHEAQKHRDVKRLNSGGPVELTTTTGKCAIDPKRELKGGGNRSNEELSLGKQNAETNSIELALLELLHNPEEKETW